MDAPKEGSALPKGLTLLSQGSLAEQVWNSSEIVALVKELSSELGVSVELLRLAPLYRRRQLMREGRPKAFLARVSAADYRIQERFRKMLAEADARGDYGDNATLMRVRGIRQPTTGSVLRRSSTGRVIRRPKRYRTSDAAS